jgi:CBS domain-containing protein
LIALTRNSGYGRLVENVLEFAKEGATKKNIMDKFNLSRPRVRMLTAELVNRDLLSYHMPLKSFMTTAKGTIYLRRKISSKKQSSKIFKAGDISREPIMLSSKQTLWDARNAMLKYNISRVIVSENDKAVGIVTEKDIARFLYKVTPTRLLSEISLKELAGKKLVTVNEESSIEECAKLMLENHISSLIVTNGEKGIKGIITKTDIVELYAYQAHNSTKVSNIMSKKVHTVAPDETLHMVAMLMVNYNISRVIVERNKKPVGIITSRDFLPISLAYGTDSLGKYWTAKTKQSFIPSGIMGMTLAQDIMTSFPITINMNTGVEDAARIMIRNRISGLPVINGNGILVGILTKTDIVKAKVIV